MFSRILLGAVSVVAGGILVSATAAAGSGGDPSAIAAASAPLSELSVAPPTDYPDVRLFRGYALSGQAAFDPADPKRLAVGIGLLGAASRCYVKASADGGRTWGSLVQLPQLADGSRVYCWSSAPAVTYAAGGGRLYAAYAYTEAVSELIGVQVSVSTDHGATWSTLIIMPPTLEEELGDVRLASAPDGPWLYLAARPFGHFGPYVVFSSSGDQGSSWTPVELIATGDSESDTFVGGFALATGRGGNVLVAYGWTEPVSTGYAVAVKVARSADHGASFLYGTADQYSTADRESTEPDIKIGPFGTAHLIYDKGSEAILYKQSPSPYKTWSAEPVRLDDNVSQPALSAPRLAVGACGKASVLHATWSEFLNEASRIVYTRRVAQPGYAWSEPLKVGTSNHPLMRSDLAGAGAKAFPIWETRPESANNWAIFGSRVWSGVTCP